MENIQIDFNQKAVFLNVSNYDDETIMNTYRSVLNSGAYQIIKKPKKIDFYTAIDENNNKFIFMYYDEYKKSAFNKLILAEAYMFLRLMAEKF
ncbi:MULTISPECIES: hypothetical protein [Campylobacter]|uniref:hypothetical protein n=1 Tax=Campylobacter TaxID=194 RepID=UPI00087479B4|nr:MULTISPECIES: hypothetical protein [Campylobacter]EAK0768226.1 hypothetical protein [Campylobacter lari]EDP6895660.1 hypothetical protein [Campylobacter lari]MCV3399084.1 hypothetical protein [Campylobacter lari]MCV3414602.1 hypothetical protein [Campylobacter lari]MCV3481697.1 hypothetical protein [Campylobacter lari]